MSINFASGSVAAAARPSTHVVHGVLNFLAWGVFLPTGVMLARFGKRLGPGQVRQSI